MSKATHALAMAGMAVIAGALIGAGPAAASAPTVQPTTTATQSTVSRVLVQGLENDPEVRYYRTLKLCNRAGSLGVREGDWDEYDCDRGKGSKRKLWKMTPFWDDNEDNGNNWPRPALT